MPDYVYPTSRELSEIEQVKLPVLTAEDPIFEMMPFEESDTDLIEWEQEDDYTGLQGVRGLNGQPGMVERVGSKAYQMRPGYYGEFSRIDETELTKRRQLGTFGTPINLSSLVMKSQDQLLDRRISRQKYIGWTLLTTGTFSVALPGGGVAHTDSYTLQTFSSLVSWASPATATVLGDFRSIKLLARGKSVNFGAQAIAYMNQTTFNQAIANTNSADLYGKRTSGLANVLSLADANAVLAGEDLPQIRIYDDGYLDDSGNFQLFLPTGKVLVRGRRPGNRRLAAYKLTRNANNPNMAPGSYTKVINKTETEVPPCIDVHDGHNGGPAIFFPSGFVLMTVN